MKSWIIYLIAATVLIGLGGVLIKAYGNSEYRRGVAVCEKDKTDDLNRAVLEARGARERIEGHVDTIDLDSGLHRLGILRQPYDR